MNAEIQNMIGVLIHVAKSDEFLDHEEKKFTGMTVIQVADEVLYTGLIEMQEMDASGRSSEVALGFTPIYIK